MSNPDPRREAKVRAAKHDAKVKQAAKRTAQKARGRAGRGSDPNKVSKHDMNTI